MLFSSFSFAFGIIFFFCICLHNLVFSWLCILFRVRILKFGLLLDAWDKYFFKKKIGNTEYILGWLPAGGYVRPLAMIKDEGDIDTILPEEKPYSLIYKPKYQQLIFRLSPSFVWPIVFIIFIFLIDNNNSWFNNFSSLLTYVSVAGQAIFGYISKEDFKIYSSETLSHYHLLPFSLLICSVIFIISTVLTTLTEIINNQKGKSILKVIGWGLTILLVYLVLWKIPKFIFSFFSWSQIFRYILSVVLGIYVASLISYWIIIFSVKINNRP